MSSKTRLTSHILIMLGVSVLAMSLVSSAQDDALVHIVNIRNQIGSGISVYISNGIERAEEANADAIVFDVDTPGGRVDSAVDIIDAIQDTEVPTIAFVNREAISAGAMISIACDQIVMVSGGTIGDSAPVSIQGEEAGEKAVSYIRKTIKSTAERQGHNFHIAVTMVDKKRVLVRMADGEIVSFRPDTYQEKRQNGEEMEVISAEGELLTLTTDEALEYGFAHGRADTIDELLAMYRIVEIDGVRKALTEEAIAQKQEELGTASMQFIKSLEGAATDEAMVSLADRIVIFLTSPLISSLLLSLGMLGLWIEIQSPGFGLPGMLGLLCLGIFFGGHMLSQIDAQWAALAFVLGLGLIVVEVFILPGFGIAGISGIILMFGGIFYVFKSAYQFETAILAFSSVIVLTAIGVIAAFYLFPKTRAWKHFALATEMSSDIGYHSAGDEDFQSYIGQTGTAITPLRPAGAIRLAGKRVNVLTAGDFIPSETPVKVIEVEGSKVFVEALDEATNTA
jgi:membrane-bound serine protease (ClpP class)